MNSIYYFLYSKNSFKLKVKLKFKIIMLNLKSINLLTFLIDKKINK
jgi:hypothetical protein